MEHTGDPMDDNDDDDELLTFRNQSELVTYMQNRLLQLGFDAAVSNAFRNMFIAVEERQSLYMVYWNYSTGTVCCHCAASYAG